jgi:hypothetical protein
MNRSFSPDEADQDRSLGGRGVDVLVGHRRMAAHVAEGPLGTDRRALRRSGSARPAAHRRDADVRADEEPPGRGAAPSPQLDTAAIYAEMDDREVRGAFEGVSL